MGVGRLYEFYNPLWYRLRHTEPVQQAQEKAFLELNSLFIINKFSYASGAGGREFESLHPDSTRIP